MTQSWEQIDDLTGPAGPSPWYNDTPGELPATSAQHLTTQGGNTLDDGSGNVVIKGGSLDNVTIGGITTATSVTTRTITDSTPTSLSGTSKPWLNQIGSYAGTLTGGGSLNSLQFNDAVVGDANYVIGLNVLHNYLAPAVGLRCVISGQLLLSGTGTNTRTEAQYVGVHGSVQNNISNFGGTSFGATGNPIGALWGGWFQGTALSGTYLDEVIGVEIDVNLADGVTVNTKNCLRIVDQSTGTVRGATDDHAVLIASLSPTGSVGSTWQDGIFFGSNQANGTGSQGHSWPFDNTSTIINCAPAATSGTKIGNPANIGLDFSKVTFTGDAITVGAGAIQAGSLTAQSNVALSGSTPQPWLNATTTATGTLAATSQYLGQAQFNSILVNDQVVGVNDVIVQGLQSQVNVQSPSVGFRTGLAGVVQIQSAGTGQTPEYVGTSGLAWADGNIGGTSTTPVGDIFGGWFVGQADVNATYWHGVYGTEIDVTAVNAPYYRCGLNVVSIGTQTHPGVRGANGDDGIVIGMQQYASTWLTGLSLGSGLTPWPFASDSTLIAAPVGGPAKTGIDLSKVTFSGNAITVGAGSIQAGSLVANLPVALSGATSKPWLNQVGFFSGSNSAGSGYMNLLSFNDQVVYTGANSMSGLQVTQNVAAPSIGNRNAITGSVTVNSVGPAASLSNTGYVGVTGAATTAANLSGTSGSPIGSFWGGWFYPRLTTGATYLSSIFGVEIDVTVQTGASVNNKIGALIALAGNDAVRGSSNDVALMLSRNSTVTTTWSEGIVFGGIAGGATWPFASDSTLIGTHYAGNANVGIDFSAVTFSGPAIKLPGAPIAMAEMSSTPSPVAGEGQIYVANDGSLHYQGPTTNTRLATDSGKTVVNVLDYGADPTGVANSTTAFTNAIAALPAAGGCLYVPGGTYVINSTLNLKPFQRIRGDGLGITVIKWYGSGACIKAANTGTVTAYPNACAFEGITVDGANSLSGSPSYGIELQNLFNCYAKDVCIQKFGVAGSIGLYFNNATSNSLSSEKNYFSGIELIYNATGVVFDGPNTSASSYDYSVYELFIVANANQNGVTLQNQAQIYGCRLGIRGNFATGAGNTGWVLAIDPGNTSGMSAISATDLDICVEPDGTTGVGHQTIVMGSANVASQISGTGVIEFVTPPAGAVNFQGASITPGSIFAVSGYISDPVLGNMGNGDCAAFHGGTAYAVHGNSTTTMPASFNIFPELGDVQEFLFRNTSATVTLVSTGLLRSRRMTCLFYQPASGAACVPTFSAGSATIKWAGGNSTFSTANGAVDKVRFDYFPTENTWYAELIPNYVSEPLEQFAVLTSAFTLTSQTAAQQLLNTTPNGAVTLQPGEYFFECGFSLTAMSATSGAFGFGFGGTATFTQDWFASAAKPTSVAGAAAVISWNTAASTNITGPGNTNTQGTAYIKGLITVTVAGTLIPQVSLTQAAAAVVAAGSFFRIQSVNSTAAYSGAWS